MPRREDQAVSSQAIHGVSVAVAGEAPAVEASALAGGPPLDAGADGMLGGGLDVTPPAGATADGSDRGRVSGADLHVFPPRLWVDT